ncbi:unnamed protein product [Microthlaspi erraticum]|uniref:Uncharacterized protein n=1 Tax=Microthlaspi erraticum TaxID=1685480 RepID=A0A6D2JQK3_9BRAS|nr:unnamed protein product [Microthlaspi erraticum]
MKGRAYVMIFFFWALLTIITPMLVSWSQALKEHKIKDSGPRRMMGYSVEMYLTREIEEEELVMEPSMAPTPEESLVLPSTNQTSMRIKQEEGLVTNETQPIRLQ